MGRVLIVVGKAWLYLVAATILLGYASILYFEGWGKLQDTLSPFNVWNWLAVVITLLPGIGLVELGKKLDKAPASSKGETMREDQAGDMRRMVRHQDTIDKARMDADVRETAHGLIQGYLSPDHKVISMQGFFSALVQALKQAREKGHTDCSGGHVSRLE